MVHTITVQLDLRRMQVPAINLFVPQQQKTNTMVHTIAKSTCGACRYQPPTCLCHGNRTNHHGAYHHQLNLWRMQVPVINLFVPRQQKAAAAVKLIRETTEMLIAKCKEMVDAEEQAAFAEAEDYMNDSDPSVLRFLIASRVEVSSQQLRDDLLGMLVAGHETTASVLTWTIYLLAQNPDQMKKCQVRVSSLDDAGASLPLQVWTLQVSMAIST